MVRVEKCSFCGGPVWQGHGTVYVRNDCRVFRFCRSKCRKFWMKKKNPRKFRWTKDYRKAAGKDLVADTTFEFEARRNSPVKYDRDLVATTLRTMRIVDEIRQQREAAHWERRMQTAAAIETRAKLVDISQNIELYSKVPEVMREQVERADKQIEKQKAEARQEIAMKRQAQAQAQKTENEQQ